MWCACRDRLRPTDPLDQSHVRPAPLQVGMKERRPGNFGGCFSGGGTVSYLARPGLRLWTADVSGKVGQTCSPASCVSGPVGCGGHSEAITVCVLCACVFALCPGTLCVHHTCPFMVIVTLPSLLLLCVCACESAAPPCHSATQLLSHSAVPPCHSATQQLRAHTRTHTHTHTHTHTQCLSAPPLLTCLSTLLLVSFPFSGAADVKVPRHPLPAQPARDPARHLVRDSAPFC